MAGEGNFIAGLLQGFSGVVTPVVKDSIKRKRDLNDKMADIAIQAGLSGEELTPEAQKLIPKEMLEIINQIGGNARELKLMGREVQDQLFAPEEGAVAPGEMGPGAPVPPSVATIGGRLPVGAAVQVPGTGIKISKPVTKATAAPKLSMQKVKLAGGKTAIYGVDPTDGSIVSQHVFQGDPAKETRKAAGTYRERLVAEIGRRKKGLVPDYMADTSLDDLDAELKSMRRSQSMDDLLMRFLDPKSDMGGDVGAPSPVATPAKAVEAPAASTPGGLITPGNIDLFAQPEVKNADGSTSTVDSISFKDDRGREVLISRVTPDGRHLNNKDAIKEYQKTGKHLGMFESPEAATKYAIQLHKDYEQGKYRRNSASGSLPEDPFQTPEIQAIAQRWVADGVAGKEPNIDEIRDVFKQAGYSDAQIAAVMSDSIASLEEIIAEEKLRIANDKLPKAGMTPPPTPTPLRR